MKIKIRQAQEKDFQKLREIWKKVGFFYEPWDQDKNLNKKLLMQSELFLVIEYGGSLAGVVIGTYDGWGAYINHLAIDPYFKGKNLENYLLLEIEKRLKNLGVKKVFVFTLPNHPENKLYKKFGYKEWGISLSLDKSI